MKKRAPNFVVKPTPSRYFTHLENGAEEMKWGPVASYGDTVPTKRFYVHNRGGAPRIDVNTWRLDVTGSGVASPRSFSYDDLLALPAVTVRRVLDCGSNCRAFFPKIAPYKGETWLPVGSVQWHFGGVGAAEWTGARVKDVLDAAGLGRATSAALTALDCIVSGGAEHRYSQVVPVEKLLADDSLLVYRMNGEVLPVDHGFPVRALLSGWSGNTAVKWLGSIEVSVEPLPLSYFQKRQTIAGPDHPVPYVLTTGPVRSALELDADMTLHSGDHVLHGRAWSGAGAIERVEVSLEKLVARDTWRPVWAPQWQDAELLHRAEPMMWVRFEVTWEGAEPGYYRLMTRATDETGNVQPRPEDVIWNQRGIGYNGHAPLGLTVLPP